VRETDVCGVCLGARTSAGNRSSYVLLGLAPTSPPMPPPPGCGAAACSTGKRGREAEGISARACAEQLQRAAGASARHATRRRPLRRVPAVRQRVTYATAPCVSRICFASHALGHASATQRASAASASAAAASAFFFFFLLSFFSISGAPPFSSSLPPTARSYADMMGTTQQRRVRRAGVSAAAVPARSLRSAGVAAAPGRHARAWAREGGAQGEGARTAAKRALPFVRRRRSPTNAHPPHAPPSLLRVCTRSPVRQQLAKREAAPACVARPLHAAPPRCRFRLARRRLHLRRCVRARLLRVALRRGASRPARSVCKRCVCEARRSACAWACARAACPALVLSLKTCAAKRGR
jgi:hypothetical protein